MLLDGETGSADVDSQLPARATGASEKRLLLIDCPRHPAGRTVGKPASGGGGGLGGGAAASAPPRRIRPARAPEFRAADEVLGCVGRDGRRVGAPGGDGRFEPGLDLGKVFPGSEGPALLAAHSD